MKSTRSLKLLLSAGTALFLVGCANQYTPMKHVGTDAFTKHLYHGYVALAQAEEAESDWADRDYFMAKAQKAAAGEAVAATNLFDRELSGDNAVAATAARSVLTSLMVDRSAAASHPGPAAKLQVAYDCYLQELEEGRQADDIKACKDEFDHQAARLEELLKEESAPEVALPGPFNVYFGLDSAKIDANYMKTIHAVAESADKANVTRINILGHADRSGNVAYNSSLGLRRAMAVQRALRAHGLDKGVKMSVSTKGEESPRVKTNDGVTERLNRRVEIVLSR